MVYVQQETGTVSLVVSISAINAWEDKTCPVMCEVGDYTLLVCPVGALFSLSVVIHVGDFHGVMLLSVVYVVCLTVFSASRRRARATC